MALSQSRTVEESPETIAFDVFGTLADMEKAVPALEPTAYGVSRFDGSNLARQVRYGNSAFQSLSLPEVEGKKGMDTANKSVFTSRFVWSDLTVVEGITHIVESGQYTDIVDEMLENTDFTQEECEIITSYNLFIVAKGWIAEKQVSEMDEYAKMWETHDVGGIDFQSGENYKQLKSYTHGLHGMEFDGSADVVFYGWANGQIVLSDDYTDVMAEIRDKHYVDNDVIRSHEWTDAPDF